MASAAAAAAVGPAPVRPPGALEVLFEPLAIAQQMARTAWNYIYTTTVADDHIAIANIPATQRTFENMMVPLAQENIVELDATPAALRIVNVFLPGTTDSTPIKWYGYNLSSMRPASRDLEQELMGRVHLEDRRAPGFHATYPDELLNIGRHGEVAVGQSALSSIGGGVFSH